jgi:hypothetical protein
VDYIIEEISDVEFKPCHSGQHSGSGRPSLSFSERRKTYFPVESKGLKKMWKHLGSPPGYISAYQQRLIRLKEEDKKTLNECLEELLNLCQCLPDSSRNQSGGWIWKVEHKKIAVITNPEFYRIEKIGKNPTTRNNKTRRAAPAQRSIKSTTIAMLVQADVPEEVAEKAYGVAQKYRTKQDRRSAKSKNKRRPPQRKKKELMNNEDMEENEEDEEDERVEEREEDNEDERVEEREEDNEDEGDEEDSEEDKDVESETDDEDFYD